MQRSGLSPEEFKAYTRRARRIAAKTGYEDVVSALAQRHFDRAGQWLRVPAAESSDLASFDFSQCFRAHLQSSWDALHLQARRRAVMGRPFAAWDSGLVQWSDGRWEEWPRTESCGKPCARTGLLGHLSDVAW